MKTVGLALGGGGAKGLAHIPMLEVFDELGVRPHRISGTSMGSIVGALYAAGLAGEEIREGVESMVITTEDSFREALSKTDALKWIEMLDFQFGATGVLKGDKFVEFLCEKMGASSFSQLEIPLRVVASDFWTSAQVVLESGDLLPAVKASMGLPGVFTPVVMGGRVLIDGGCVNPVPHDLLLDCDVVVAVDVMGCMGKSTERMPNLFRAVLGTFDIMQNSIVAGKLKSNPPDIYIKPDIVGVDILDFHKMAQVQRQAEPERLRLRQELCQRLDL